MIKLSYISTFAILALSINFFGCKGRINPVESRITEFQNIEQQANAAQTKNETLQTIGDFNRLLNDPYVSNITQDDRINIDNQIRETYRAIENRVQSFHPHNMQLIRSRQYRNMNQELTNLNII